MSIMYAQMGMSVVSAINTWQNTNYKMKMDALMRDHQNTMSAISKAMSLNAQTDNEIGMRDAVVNASQALQVQSMADKAEGAAGAAASGVTGGSVSAAMLGLERSKLKANSALKARVKAQSKADLQARRNIAVSAAFNKDITASVRPSTASVLLGLGTSLLDIYDTHQPDGQKLTDKI